MIVLFFGGCNLQFVQFGCFTFRQFECVMPRRAVQLLSIQSAALLHNLEQLRRTSLQIHIAKYLCKVFSALLSATALLAVLFGLYELAHQFCVFLLVASFYIANALKKLSLLESLLYFPLFAAGLDSL